MVVWIYHVISFIYSIRQFMGSHMHKRVRVCTALPRTLPVQYSSQKFKFLSLVIFFLWYGRCPLYLITFSLGVRLLVLTWLIFIANCFSSRIQSSPLSWIQPGGPVWFICTRVHTCAFNTKICTCAKNTTKNQHEIQRGCAFIRNHALTCVYRCGYGSTYSRLPSLRVLAGAQSPRLTKVPGLPRILCMRPSKSIVCTETESTYNIFHKTVAAWVHRVIYSDSDVEHVLPL